MDLFSVQSSIVLKDQVTEGLRRVQDEAQKTDNKLSAMSGKFSKVGESLSSIGSKLTTRVSLPLIGIGAASAKLASDFNESLNKVQVAFGKNSNDVEKWSKTTLKSFGIAQGTALDMSSLFGDMATSMGLNTDQASKMSMSMVGLAGDLASFKNIGIDQATTALNGVFTGETESLKMLGIVMTQANLQQFAYSKGINKNIQDMSQAEQVQLRYAYVMDKTKNAQGDFTRTSDGTANSTRTFTESLKQLGATFGQNILPVITPIIQKLTDVVTWFGSLDSGTQKVILGFGGFIVSLGLGLVAVGKISSGIGETVRVINLMRDSTVLASAATKVMTVAQTALNLVMSLNPIGIVILALAALVAGFIVAYNKVDWFRNMVNGAFTSIKNAITTVWNLISGFKFPSFKLPHFKISGSFSLAPPSMPKLGVDWYSSGAIFTQPTIMGGIGVGDKNNGLGSNAEAVLPINELGRILKEQGIVGSSQTIHVHLNVDGKELAYVVAENQDILDRYNSRDRGGAFA